MKPREAVHVVGSFSPRQSTRSSREYASVATPSHPTARRSDAVGALTTVTYFVLPVGR